MDAAFVCPCIEPGQRVITAGHKTPPAFHSPYFVSKQRRSYGAVPHLLLMLKAVRQAVFGYC
jgi:hypothetical protein